jgi:hypothetical protein
MLYGWRHNFARFLTILHYIAEMMMRLLLLADFIPLSLSTQSHAVTRRKVKNPVHI